MAQREMNKLKLNPDKTVVLFVGTISAWGSGNTLILNEVALPLNDHVHSLAVPLDPALLLDKQVVSVARNAFYQLWAPF